MSLLGRAGWIHARTQGSFGATGAARMPYARANLNEHAAGYKGHVALISLGVVYRFGAASPPPVAAAPAPAIVVAAPAPRLPWFLHRSHGKHLPLRRHRLRCQHPLPHWSLPPSHVRPPR